MLQFTLISGRPIYFNRETIDTVEPAKDYYGTVITSGGKSYTVIELYQDVLDKVKEITFKSGAV